MVNSACNSTLISSYNLANKINFYYKAYYNNISYKDVIKESISISIDSSNNFNFIQKEYLKFIISFF